MGNATTDPTSGRDDVVAGYSVALRPTKGERPVWYGGGRLARDLTLPRLRKGWPDSVEVATTLADFTNAVARLANTEKRLPDEASEIYPAYARLSRKLRNALRRINS